MVDASTLHATVIATANGMVEESKQRHALLSQELGTMEREIAVLRRASATLGGGPEQARAQVHRDFNDVVARVESMRECLGMDFGALQHRQGRIQNLADQCKRQIEVLDQDISAAQSELGQRPRFTYALSVGAAEAEARLNQARADRSRYLVMWHKQWQSSLQAIVNDVANYRAATSEWSADERATLTARVEELHGEIGRMQDLGGDESRRSRLVRLRMNRISRERAQLSALARLYMAKRQAKATATEENVGEKIQGALATGLASHLPGSREEAGARLRAFNEAYAAADEAAWRARLDEDARAAAAAEEAERNAAAARLATTKAQLGAHFDAEFTGAINELTSVASAQTLAAAQAREESRAVKARTERLRTQREQLRVGLRVDRLATTAALEATRARVLAEWTRRGTGYDDWAAVAKRITLAASASAANLTRAESAARKLRAARDIITTSIRTRELLQRDIARLKGVGVAGALPQSDLETIAVTLWEKHNQLCELDVALKKTLLDYRYRNGADLMLGGRPYIEQLGARL